MSNYTNAAEAYADAVANTPDDCFAVPTGLWKVGRGGNATEFVLLLTLLYCDQNKLSTSLNSLARQTGMSIVTVIKGLKGLIGRGLIVKQLHKGVDNSNLASTYVIQHDAIAAFVAGK